MTIRTYRIYVSGKMSPRFSNLILHKMLGDLGLVNPETTSISDQTVSLRNMHRELEEAYFDVDIPLENNNNNTDNDEIISTVIEPIKRYIVENSVQYEDITTEPPTDA